MTDTAQHHRRVLFVDDDPQFLATVVELMKSFSNGSWDILTADGAGTAFTLLQDHPVDLAVVDVEMGVMDGIQMLSLLNRGHPTVQKVVLTGVPSEKYRSACLANGAELFLEKPKTPEGWQQVYIALKELLRFHSDSDQGFRGVLRRVGLQDVLQMECLARNSTVLEISDARTRGQIFVEQGQIIHAQVGALQGEDAFNRLLCLTGGQFNLKPFVEPPARTIQGQWEFLLMEAAQKRDEAEATQTTLLAKLEVEPAPASPQSRVETLLALTEAAEKPVPAIAPVSPTKPTLLELIVCSGQGEILHEWPRRNTTKRVTLFEFVSQHSQRLARGLALGDFDRLVIESPQARTVVIITSESGVLVSSEAAPQPSLPAISKPEGATVPEALTAWVQLLPPINGERLRALRLAGRALVCEHDSADFPRKALEQSVRATSDAFDVLASHALQARHLVWQYQRGAFYCARRSDGAVLGLMMQPELDPADSALLLAMLEAFRSHGITPGTGG